MSGWDDDWDDLGRMCNRLAMMGGAAVLGTVVLVVGLVSWVWSLTRDA